MNSFVETKKSVNEMIKLSSSLVCCNKIVTAVTSDWWSNPYSFSKNSIIECSTEQFPLITRHLLNNSTNYLYSLVWKRSVISTNNEWSNNDKCGSNKFIKISFLFINDIINKVFIISIHNVHISLLIMF